MDSNYNYILNNEEPFENNIMDTYLGGEEFEQVNLDFDVVYPDSFPTSSLNEEDIESIKNEFFVNTPYQPITPASSSSSDSGRYSPNSVEFQDNYCYSNQQVNIIYEETKFDSPPYTNSSVQSFDYQCASPDVVYEYTSSSPVMNTNNQVVEHPNNHPLPNPNNQTIANNRPLLNEYIQTTGPALRSKNAYPMPLNPVHIEPKVTQTQQPQILYLNPVQIVQQGSVQLQPIQLVTPSTSPMCFVIDNGNQIQQNNIQIDDPVKESHDLISQKKAERKAKNRVAAQTSRDRKKNEITDMQAFIKTLETENAMLKGENHQLKNRILQLESENKKTLNEYAPYRKKAKLGAFTAICMIGLLVTFQGNDYFRQYSPTDVAIRSTDVQVLSYKSPESKVAIQVSHSPRAQNWLKKMGRSMIQNNVTDNLKLIKNKNTTTNEKFSNCSHYPFNEWKSHLNQSARNKINDEISSWIKKHGSNFNSNEHRMNQNKDYLRSLENTIYTETIAGQLPKNQLESNAPVAVVKRPQINLLNTLVGAMKRKNDTIYVMPERNYYILPSLKTDNNTIPKISIIIPSKALSSDDSPSQITMLKIECQIIGTEIFNAPDNLFSTTFKDAYRGFV
uniref:BZIP domain-containing protein n=1 Tax=Rhabditophanes sp. KR3021 TaxID=114890 RepID=A0AC35TP78_9BILA